MKKMIAVSLFLFPFFQATAADCDNVQTQLDMNECAYADYKKADDELNMAYQKIVTQISGEQRNLLKTAQNKWIIYRDADCKFQSYKSSDGTVNPMNIAMCLQAKTKQRTQELLSVLNCPEGDVSCPL
ncbi:TPA: lysozyme inhibitor LprI family protein [Serratia marcescens]